MLIFLVQLLYLQITSHTNALAYVAYCASMMTHIQGLMFIGIIIPVG